MPISEDTLNNLVAEERAADSLPLNDWDTLAARLRAEGLIRESAPRHRFDSRVLLRVAAGILLAAGGAALGRVTAGAPVIPGSETQPVASEESETTYSSVRPDPGASLASSATPEFHSPEEAWEVLNRAGEQYQRASAYLSESNTEIPMPASPSIYRTRLAALDNVMSEMRDALKEAPQDPVINQYYLATVGAREATLRQLGTTLPAGARLDRF